METKQYLPEALRQFEYWDKHLKTIKSKDVELLEPMLTSWIALITKIRETSQKDGSLTKSEQFNFHNIEFITRFFSNLKHLISVFKFNNGTYKKTGRAKPLKEFKNEFSDALRNSISFAKRAMQSDT